ELYLVLHLMIAGRLRWRPPRGRIPARRGIAALDFPTGTLLVTEAGTRKRASLHLVEGAQALAALAPARAEAPAAALPRSRLPRAAHRPRRQRDQLLRALPDGRRAPRRPVALPAPQERLAAEPRGDGSGAGSLSVQRSATQAPPARASTLPITAAGTPAAARAARTRGAVAAGTAARSPPEVCGSQATSARSAGTPGAISTSSAS